MWLALLLAAADDTLEARGRRAALHELRQRLLPVTRARPLAYTEVWLEALRAFIESPKYSFETYKMWDRLSYDFMIDLYGTDALRDLNLSDQTWNFLPGIGVGDRNRSILQFSVPDADRASLLRAATEGTPFVPTVRTPFDGLLRLVLQHWAAGGYWFASNANLHVHADLNENLASVGDWMRAMHPDLTGMTWPMIREASIHWHRSFHTGLVGRPCPPALVVLRWPDGWTLQRLTEKADLAREGESLDHCVGGPDRGGGRRDGESEYWQAVRDNRANILSLRDPDGVPHATVELLSNDYIRQVQGVQDTCPAEPVLARLRQALDTLGGWRHLGRTVRLGYPGFVSNVALLAGRDGQEFSEMKTRLQAILRTGRRGQSPDGRTKTITVAGRGTQALRILARVIGETTTRDVHLETDSSDSPAVDGWTGVTASYLRDDHGAATLRLIVNERGTLGFWVQTYDRTLYRGPDWKDAVRVFTGRPEVPPVVEGIEVFPGVPDALRTPYGPFRDLQVSVERARAFRAAQAAVLKDPRRVS